MQSHSHFEQLQLSKHVSVLKVLHLATGEQKCFSSTQSVCFPNTDILNVDIKEEQTQRKGITRT